MTIPPDVVRILASSTVLVKASSLVNLDFAGIAAPTARETGGHVWKSNSSCKRLVGKKGLGSGPKYVCGATSGSDSVNAVDRGYEAV